MSKKIYFSVFLILLLGLTGTSQAAVDYQGKRAYWSDLDPANHNWNEPNNWWTMEEYYDNVEEEYSCVKAESNEVPDANTRVFFGKGEAHQNYPVYLKEYVLDDNVIIEPVIDSGTFDINDILCGGGEENLDGSIGDPNLNHYLTITGGTLNVGTPILGEDWYRAWDPYGFGGQFGEIFGTFRSGALRIGIVRGGTGTMNMTGGTVNLGGHIEIGAWGGEGELNMDGGTINITQGFYCTSALYGATGRAYLRGGTINAGYLDMITQDYYSGDESSSGLIDFAGGKMVLEGDESEEVLNFAAGNVAGATITAYGTALGKIVKDSSSPMNGRRAFLSVAYGIDCNTTVQAATAEPEQAWDPRPAENSAYVMGPPETVARPQLSWSSGDDVETHDVYLGTDFDEVNDANDPDPDPDVFMATLPKTEVTYTPTANLQALTDYYWRIDEVDKNNNITKGQVWTFKTADFAKATYPVPPHEATGVFPDELTWTPGIHAETHDVYFSSDFNDVNDRIDVNNIEDNVYPVPSLQLDTTYYWRVDELNGLDMWDGDLWTFTITDHMNIDDMEAYESSVNEIYWTWEDWQDPDNDTAAEVFIDSAVIYDGNQSMRFNYVNEYTGGNYYSEARADIADLEIGPDWTKGGAKTVVIHFYGDKDNIVDANNHMYFAIEDAFENTAAIQYPGDMTDFQDPGWHEWNIALEDFNDINNVVVTNVARVYIGFGDRDIPSPPGSCLGGEGSDVYFDALEIRPRRCAAAASHPYGDINGDCIVNYDDVGQMSADWLVVDYNTVGFTGELIGFTEDICDPNYDECWVDGRTGDGEGGDYALEFGYGHPREDEQKDTPTSDDFVKVPPLNWYSNTMTITVWVKRHGHQRDDSAIFYCDGQHEVRWEEGDTVAGLNIGIPVKRGDESLGYMWPDVTDKIWQWNPQISILPDYQWAFCALVVEPGTGTIYIQLPGQGLEVDSTTAYTHLVAKFAIPSTIAMHKERFFDGVIDDLRIFKEPLEHEEIQWLASDGTIGDPEDDPGLPYIWYKFDEGTGLTTEDSGSCELMYHPNPSRANIYETQDEPIYRRYVNFTDYSVLADNWLRNLEFPFQ